jgi:hypothetical protein
MKTFSLLAAIALVSLTQPAAADCSGSGCAIQQPSDEPIIRQEPANCSGYNCATPTAPALKLACCGSVNCATVVVQVTPDGSKKQGWSIGGWTIGGGTIRP